MAAMTCKSGNALLSTRRRRQMLSLWKSEASLYTSNTKKGKENKLTEKKILFILYGSESGGRERKRGTGGEGESLGS